MLTATTYQTSGQKALTAGLEAGRSWSDVCAPLFGSDSVMGLERGHKYIQAPATTHTNPGGLFR